MTGDDVRPVLLTALDIFSCVGCHALGFARAGIRTIGFCEIAPARRAVLARHFPGVPIHDDIRTFGGTPSDIIIGGPPCRRTSVAAAVHGYRSGESLWPEMRRLANPAHVQWAVVEQPPGNAPWETEVADDLYRVGYQVARFEFGASDVGAPYIRRRVFMVASADEQRLARTRQALPSEIVRVQRAAHARGDWNPDQLGTLRVDAGSAGEVDSRTRRGRIEALGDSNPPHMAEAIGRAIIAAYDDSKHDRGSGGG